MELTLKRLLEQAEFTQSRKGYDQDQVDDFLDRAVAMAAKVETRLTQALDQAKGPAAPPGPSPADMEAEVERRVQARLDELPTAPTRPSEEESAEEVRRTIVLAQRTADAAVKEAREDAAKLLADAQERASALQAEADASAASAASTLATEVEAERKAAREQLASEIGELEGAREALRTDVTVLERHVEEQRGQLGSTVAELQRLLDDPAGFRVAPVPALLDPKLPDLRDLTQAAPVELVAPEPEPEAVAVVDHEAPGPDDAHGSSGAPTAPVAAVDLGFPPPAVAPETEADDEDAFLAELRKAMADDEPLGPRDQIDAPGDAVFEDEGNRSWRRGKRR